VTDTTFESGDPIVWRVMSRAELDRAYNNGAAVAESAAILAAWTLRSASLREAHPDLLDLAYGDRPRNRIDVFRCGRAGAPLLAFIHGGYWQRNGKEMFAGFAEGPLAAGFDVAMVGYTLAPDASLTEIVGEIGAAIGWLRGEGPGFGVATGKLIVSGWSAGGHLTAAMMGRADVDGGLAISGVFDLEPCRLNYLNAALNLDAEEAAAMSPLHHLPQWSGQLVVAFGEDELPELQRQSRDFAAAWQSAGLPVRLLPMPARNHFTIMDELMRPDGELVRAATSLLT
jgi:arylformamidase